MYTVTIHHHCKVWYRGDLEDEFKLIQSENFKTRKRAKEWIESKITRGHEIVRHYRKGDLPSIVVEYTGETWQHENSGEIMYEYYQYTLKKTEVR